MIVALRLEVTDDTRRALRVRLEKSGLATRAEVAREVERLWERHIQGAAPAAPLAAPEQARPERAPLADLALYTTDTLRATVEKRDRAAGRIK